MWKVPHHGPGGAVLQAFLGWEFVPVPPCRACVPLKKPEGLSLARERGSRCLQVLGRLRMMLSPPFRIPTWTWTRPCRCTALGAGSRSRTVCHQQGELRIWVGPRDSPAPLWNAIRWMWGCVLPQRLRKEGERRDKCSVLWSGFWGTSEHRKS